MDNYSTLPMPAGFGKQVETPQGWQFRHCGTFFVGDMCPDCHKLGFMDAAAGPQDLNTDLVPTAPVIAVEAPQEVPDAEIPTTPVADPSEPPAPSQVTPAPGGKKSRKQ